MPSIVQAAAAQCVVTASPAMVANDGLTSSYVTLTVLDGSGTPVPGVDAAACVLAVTGTGNTVTQPVGVTDANGQTTGSFVSTVAATKTCSFTVAGLAITDTADVVVSGSEVAPDVEDTFATYTDTTDFRADPLGLYDAVEEVLTSTYAAVNLDTTKGYGALTQSMQMAFADATAEGGSGTSGRCTNGGHSAWREIDLPAVTTELWIEVVSQWQSTYSCGGGSWGCSSAPEHKWFLAGVGGGTGRFNLECMNGQYVWGYPGGETTSVISSPRPDALFDGAWHTLRFHIRVGAGGTGRARYWVDGALMADLNNVTIDRTAITTWSLGETRNQGAAANYSWWIGSWRAWLNGNDPGWV